ncbi:hypothetical protein TVAG_233220 [Trichomonas vaginalis G3]|uniref:Uncharacterized protein n=1 Tax=Trichomonas vaginalis (strain ATCC PRA-98 / G3) TaxID=412133 RepID=A2ERZ1_TRIV3|nr:hypothetical protein TVAGG3_0486770 [Trichomonas vaginalis G3]EAY04586.1 hypothetical protein TVAG_233220 [Trichomonas vaginalis G3]KAI5516087.1 hypothetical protein TVAGG3_0486770 [Trichomonas vaginalis G3]|eukprot:XP_001316809.1 hypothetical protein [Trichomonas vaginalis G3]
MTKYFDEVLKFIYSLRPELYIIPVSKQLMRIAQQNTQLFKQNKSTRIKCHKTKQTYKNCFVKVNYQTNFEFTSLQNQLIELFEQKNINIHDQYIAELGFYFDDYTQQNTGNTEKYIVGYFYFAFAKDISNSLISRDDYKRLINWDRPLEENNYLVNDRQTNKSAIFDDDDDFSDLQSIKKNIATSQPLVIPTPIKLLPKDESDSDDFSDLPMANQSNNKPIPLQIQPVQKLPLPTQKEPQLQLSVKTDSSNKTDLTLRPSTIIKSPKNNIKMPDKVDFDFINDPDYVPQQTKQRSFPSPPMRKNSMRISTKSKYHTLELNSALLAKSGLSKSQTKLLILREDDADDSNYN